MTEKAFRLFSYLFFSNVKVNGHAEVNIKGTKPEGKQKHKYIAVRNTRGCVHVMNLHPRTTGHPRNSLCLEHALPLARTRAYRHVVPGFILMEKPGAWECIYFLHAHEVSSALELET